MRISLKSGKAKGGKLVGIWNTGFGPSDNYVRAGIQTANSRRDSPERTRFSRRLRARRSGFLTPSPSSSRLNNNMSAHTIETLPDRHDRRDISSAMTVFSPRSKQARHLRAIADEVTLYGWDDAVESREELIRGVEEASPLSWRHGGLNE